MRSFLTFFNKKNIIIHSMWALIFILGSCSSTSNPAQENNISDKQIKQVEDKMFAGEKPEAHFSEIRDYVLDQYPDMPDDVANLITKTKPKFVKNELDMEYSFFWTLPDGSIIEVVTTPPPLFAPMDIHHSKKIQYE